MELFWITVIAYDLFGVKHKRRVDTSVYPIPTHCATFRHYTIPTHMFFLATSRC